MKTTITIIMAALLMSCGKPNPQQPVLTPTPDPILEKIARIEKIVDAMKPISSTTPTATPFQEPDMFSPWDTDADKAAKIAKKGFFITDEAGNAWGKLSRDDNKAVTLGIPIEGCTLLTAKNIEPTVTQEADGWNVRWHIHVSPTPVPAGQDSGPGKTAPLTTTPSAIPQPIPTAQPK